MDASVASFSPLNGTPATLLADYQPPAFLVDAVDLTFELDPSVTTVTGIIKMRRNTARAGHPPLRLDGEGLELVSIAVDGTALPRDQYRMHGDGMTIAPTAFKAEKATLEIKVKIHPAKNTSLMGLYVSNGNFFTQCEAEGFRKIMYFPDRPDVMAKYAVTLIADKAKYPVLLANGNLREKKNLDGGKHSARWVDPFVKPSYLFALVAGKLAKVEEKIKTVAGKPRTLQIYVEEKDLDQTAHAMTSLKKSIAWDEERFGLALDLEQYMVVAVGDFNMGAMENKGLNIFNTKYVLAKPETATDVDFDGIESVIAHEYFHNWTGNRVTCRDWFQLSLKEGLTVFRDQEFSMDMSGSASAAAVKRIGDVRLLRAAQFAEDAGPMAHPVRPDSYQEINNFYTVTIYEKGAEVVRMVQTLLGREGFRKGMDLYFERHDGHAVTCDDFAAAMRDANGGMKKKVRKQTEDQIEEAAKVAEQAAVDAAAAAKLLPAGSVALDDGLVEVESDEPELLTLGELTQFKRWYAQAGTPRLKIEGEYDTKERTYALRLTQSTPATPGQEVKKPFMIPFAVGLVDAKGKDVPLRLVGDPAPEKGKPVPTTRVLRASGSHNVFVFSHVASKPVPSLLRGFSAPVIVDYDYSDADLQFLFAHDSDPFNRWEAGQRYFTRTLLDLIVQAKKKKGMALDKKVISAVKAILVDPAVDAAFKAEALLLPSETMLAEQVQEVDPHAIHTAREFMIATLAKTLRRDIEATYKALEVKGAYSPAPTPAGKRALRNLLLAWLARLGDREAVILADKQYQAATNMTDRMGALAALSLVSAPARANALKDFYTRFASDALVLDKWFAIQAVNPGTETLKHVQALMGHSAYLAKNPNKMRALIGSFCHSNPSRFHDANGKGYAFWADRVIEIDAFNPQVAARLARALSAWKKLEPKRRELAHAALKRVAGAAKLSRDTAEVVSKTLV